MGRPHGIKAEVFTAAFKAPVLLHPGIGCQLPENEMGSSEENARALILLGQVDTYAAKACSGSERGLGRDL